MLRISKKWLELLNSYNENPYGIKKDKRIDDWNKIISSLSKLKPTKVDLKKMGLNIAKAAKVPARNSWDFYKQLVHYEEINCNYYD